MKGIKKSIFRRDSDTSSLRHAPELEKINNIQPPPLNTKDSYESKPKSRTQDDESIFINQPKLSNSSSPLLSQRVEIPSYPSNLPTSLLPSIPNLPPQSQTRQFQHQFPQSNFQNANLSPKQEQYRINQYVIEFIDRLNLGPLGEVFKKIAVGFLTYLLSSKYINSDPSSQIHIQSFLYGVILTAIVFIIQPLLSNYLDSWMILLIRLGKHLVGWIVVGVALSYALKQQSTNGSNGLQTVEPRGRGDIYEKLEYSVKSSRSTSPFKQKNKPVPSKPKFARFASAPTAPQIKNTAANNNRQNNYNEMMITKMTGDYDTNIDSRSIGYRNNNYSSTSNNFTSQSTGPTSHYDRFMTAANEKHKQNENYERFVNETSHKRHSVHLDQ
ncbi:hypothetical protein WICMUC_001723 [Wickerhamomyces mucosus]|uniref:Uncharacterized protein n=1 Tax=Wickerhamomyces mucosus TaxID=1378264 RepID=A0A9P8PU06_9ASCO|nr:hypothetical protein WICMUC_001723 [Wickerhamomyces mucosus]